AADAPAPRPILATLNVVDDARLLGECELGLSEEAFARLGVPEGSSVEIAQAEPPPSVAALRRKIDGARLAREDYAAIVRDIAAHKYSKIELAAFVVAMQHASVDADEVLYLTEAMVAAGTRIQWLDAGNADTNGRIVDKHCIGGIPGNRTSMLIVPIVAAYARERAASGATAGLRMPKTSSRAITSPAGTADTMECLADVELPIARLRAIVQAQHACLAWGGRARLSPADDVLIAVSRPLALDSPAQMVASILSKKIAAGSTHLLLDIPLGPTAKVRRAEDARRLRDLFFHVAVRLGLTVEIVLTDGRQPIGAGIGPALEARDVMRVLHDDPLAPPDLREKSVRLAGRVLELDPAVPAGNGGTMAQSILASGRAAAAMDALIEAQGRRVFDWRAPQLSPLVFDVPAERAGVVAAIDNLRLAQIARLAGAPQSKSAGVDLFHKLGARVARGTPLYRIHAGNPADLQFARRMATHASGYTIGDAVEPADPATEF
ncbi:MAG TPA: thymidine phosphorylase family protein, partial [Burkholderiaceae bacterium]|nr:thymidine phosphorylase family protein [Burkholderiaceae bacterium]